ncbi:MULTISPECIES: hypothetical protein [Pseudomonas]|uniref:hypothetical protein n=1 Tax=Pseudomonas TaxID=286 RepID=UPI0003B9D461|nr:MULTISPECIES: hypothetical protein [Pseudomonas]KSW25785.1 hypothetical protein AOX63_19130 [Pseudomonas sp. ADP]AVR85003.1 hypothetical protein C8257_24805 [Pseudomonas aeruginosa]ELT9666031.1 hypothetical protein [Pseudomonas aeruginosa]ERU33574.1 hypothetical protein Q092_05303 [Pseudomonas aeruginosa CF77]MBG5825171.1 hypothetical protein [Pseudomonas aeruginosa]
MSENEKPLRWLRRQDGEWEWAADYLVQRLDSEYIKSIAPNPTNRLGTYENVVSAIGKIRKNDPELVIRLQGAVRQRRYRSDSNGRKPLTFTLSKETISRLKHLAKRHETSETAVITALIDKAGQAAEAEKNYEKQLKESISRERKIAGQITASMSAQRDEALKHVERYLRLLAQWERKYPDGIPSSDSDDDINERIEARMKDLKSALAYMDLRDRLTTERPT